MCSSLGSFSAFGLIIVSVVRKSFSAFMFLKHQRRVTNCYYVCVCQWKCECVWGSILPPTNNQNSNNNEEQNIRCKSSVESALLSSLHHFMFALCKPKTHLVGKGLLFWFLSYDSKNERIMQPKMPCRQAKINNMEKEIQQEI